MGPLNESEIEALYTRLEKPLYNVLYRWVWNREEACDLVQESFVRLWRMRHKVVPDTVEPLVYKIALNLAKSKLRRKKILRWVPLESLSGAFADRADLEESAFRGEDRTRLRRAILALPDGLRQIVLLCEFTELNYRQIADALSIPEGTVGSRRNRALKDLRRMLSREQVDEQG